MSEEQVDKAIQEASSQEPVLEVRKIRIADIRPSRHQARKSFSEESIKKLAVSIDQEGLIQPITVRRVGNEYELIAGERRLRACKSLGHETIEVRVAGTVSEAESAAKGLIENLQREDLNPAEESEGFQRLLDLKDSHWNQERIAEVTGKDPSYISRSLQILCFPQDVLEKLRARNFSRSHALELLRLPTPEDQSRVANEIVEKKLSWENTRKLVNSLVKGKKKAKKAEPNCLEKNRSQRGAPKVWRAALR